MPQTTASTKKRRAGVCSYSAVRLAAELEHLTKLTELERQIQMHRRLHTREILKSHSVMSSSLFVLHKLRALEYAFAHALFV